MIADLWAVLWKELKELPLRQGRGLLGKSPFSALVFPLVFGVFLPWQMGHAWVESPSTLSYWAWVPLLLVTSVVADSFAGERERHTLETLLASRLPEPAILLGKVAAAVVYGWGMTMVSFLLGLVTVNVAHARGQLLLYPANVAAGVVVLSLLGAGLAASAGVLISLRAPTVRQAQQTLSLAILVLLFGGIYGLRALPPAWQAALLGPLERAGITQVVLVAAAGLVLLNLVLLALAMARFQRARLILD
jgi:ABC-2 type transport system permease protein